ncbi:hypothetical protein F4Z99_16835, partial [Candidatus Poribacteria bacterium]|nr:hypothetical protein [Candidatus Poribacteria bacterium]
METKQPTEREQQEMKTKQKVASEQSIDAPDNTIGENVSSDKRKILERIWTFCVQHPIGAATCVGAVLVGIGTLLMGIAAIRSDSSNLSLKGEDIIKFIQAVRSEDSPQVKKFIQKIERNPKASDIDRAVAEAYRLEKIGKIDDAIEKWRSIANVTEGVNNGLAAGAWFAVGYLYLD